jgi:large subunit GTPase 1
LQSGSDGEDEENEDDDQDDQDEALEGEEVEVHIDEDADDEYNEQHGFVDVGSGDVGDVQDKGEFEGDASNVHPESDYEDEPGLKSSANYSVMNEDPTRILTIDQLEGLLLEEAPAPSSVDTKLQIGLVGYPNVGKSSTINALIGAKKVSVSSTPGKTKHFQTIHLSDKIVLCDCPGLVFPNFAITNADLVCNGVLPIDQLREYTGPIQLVCQRIPKYFLEAVYGISIFTKPMSEGGTGIPTAEELLIAYARSRGFMRSGVGAPDESRAARYILKDYVNAKLQFCHPPPTYGEDLDDPGMEFNKALYTLRALPEARQHQILIALQSSTGEKVEADHVNLATALSGLRFSQHAQNGMPSTRNISSASDKLDSDFFATGSRGHTLVPFHQRGAQDTSKKHFKKGAKKRTVRGDMLSYGGSFGDLY